MHHYRGFSGRPRSEMPIHRNFLDASKLPTEVADVLTQAEQRWKDPYVGITTDGTVLHGLYRLEPTGIDNAAAVDCARVFLSSLTPAQRGRVQLEVEAPQWRLWTNAIPTWHPTTGVLLDDLDESQRGKALNVIESCMSVPGFTEVRATMKLNAALGELIDDYRDTLREFMYQFTIFGDPSTTGPWGWQLAGHHVDLHCLLVDGQMVIAPVFLGAEPNPAIGGTYDGLSVFDLNRTVALGLRASFSPSQVNEAVLSQSLSATDLPPELSNPHKGRHQGGMGSDNVTIPYEGIAAAQLRGPQQDILWTLIKLYVDRMPHAHASRKLDAVERYLGDTHFSWRGGAHEGSAFYYRIHSPVLLIEYDHHAGVFLNNDEPQPFHCHTIVREPNGNDYGKDLLRQHLARSH